MSEKRYKEITERSQMSDHEIESLITDPVIRESLVSLKMDILISGWVVKGSSDAVALFCRHVLSRVWVELMMTLMDAVAKGTQACEVTWDIEDLRVIGRSYPASVVPKNFYVIPKSKIRFLWDEDKRELVGIRYQKPNGGTSDLIEEKVMWYSFFPTDSSWPFGRSILEKIRPTHEMSNDAMELLGAYVENLTMPPIIGYAPPGEIRDWETGEVLDGLEYMGRRIRELRESGIGVFPTDLTPEGHPKWRVDFQSGASPAGSVEIARILEILREFKKSAIYSPAAGQSPMMGALPVGLPGYILREILDALNKQILKHLVYLNWGPEEWAYIEPADQAADTGLVRDIVRSTIQFSDPDRQRILGLLDWYALLQMFGLPLSMEEKEPEVIPPDGGGLGGFGMPMGGGLGALGGLGGMPMGGLPAGLELPEGLELPDIGEFPKIPEMPVPESEEEKALRRAISG